MVRDQIFANNWQITINKTLNFILMDKSGT